MIMYHKIFSNINGMKYHASKTSDKSSKIYKQVYKVVRPEQIEPRAMLLK